MILQSQIEQLLKEQNWRVVDNIIKRQNCCEWASHIKLYQNYQSITEKRQIHKLLGGLRACRQCLACFQLGVVSTDNKPSRDNCQIVYPERIVRKNQFVLRRIRFFRDTITRYW